MKKLSILIIVVMLFTVGCGGKEASAPAADTEKVEAEATVETNNETPASTDAEVTEEANEYLLTYKDAAIKMHAEIKPITDALGEPDFYFEAESCAFQGMDKTYTYGGFEIHTYEANGNDYVASILFINDTQATDEKVALFDKIEDVKKAYGEKFEESLGLYTYTLGESKVTFLVENDEISSIEFIALNVDERQK